MKRIKLVFIAFTLSVLAFQLTAQHALHDALILKKYSGMAMENGQKRAILKDDALMEDDEGNLVLRNEVAQILAKYAGVQPSNLSQSLINQTFGGQQVRNPFYRVAFTSMSGIESSMLKASASQPAASGNPVSILVDGIARFLVKRTKAELTLAFFDDFKKEVEEDALLRDFFPVTRQMLLAIDSEVYQFQIYLDALRDAFIADLKVLPGCLETYLRQAPVAKLKPAQQAISIDFFHVVQGFINGAPPPEIIRYCASIDSSAIQAAVSGNVDLKNIAAGFKTVDLFSQAVFNPETGKWYEKIQLDSALNDSMTMQIFMGLLWQNSRSITVTFKNGLKVEELVGLAATTANLMDTWKSQLREFSQLGTEWQKNLQSRPSITIQQQDEAQIPLLDNFYRTLQIFSRLLESVNTVYQIIHPKEPAPIQPDQINLVQQIGGLSFNVSHKHYSAAIGNTAAILSLCLGDQFKGKNTFLKYGSFIGAVADAQSADEVENAIEIFALPPGSSKAKKEAGKFTIALNAYTGVSAAAERFKNSSVSYGTASVAAPIGFSLNWGQNWGKNPGCVGLFFPIIDVGAVFAYRFKEDDGVENLPAMAWKNIIAPGAYFVMDPPLGKWPITIGLGGQLGPLLRKVDQGGTFENQEVGAYRIGGFLTFDIPINFLKVSNRD